MKKFLVSLLATALTAVSSFGQVPFQAARVIVTSNEVVGAAAGSTPATELETVSTSTSSPRGIMSSQFNTGTDGSRFHGRKARGTRVSPLVVVTGDNLTRWVGSGYDGSSFLEMASIIFGTEGTIASTRVPTNITFQTATNAAPSVLTSRLKIDSSGVFTFHPDAPGATITASASGEFTIAAAGTNQNITATPSGAGKVKIGAFVSSAGAFIGADPVGTSYTNLWLGQASPLTTNFVISSDGNSTLFNGGAANGAIRFFVNGSEKSRFAVTTGDFLLGGLTTDNGTAQIQLAGGSSAAVATSTGSLLLKPAGTTAATVSSTGIVVVGTVGSSGFARVTGDVTNATATMSNLTNLSVTVAAGIKYVGTIQIFANDSTGADGLAFDLGGGGATFTDLEFGFTAQPTGATLGTVTSTTSTTAITLTVVSTSDAVYTVSFGFTCNAGGTFIPRFAQNSHSAGTATVRKNSGIITLASTN